MGDSSDSNPECLVNESYFAALFNEVEIFSISDEKYADELQLQEALFSSLTHLTICSSLNFTTEPMEEQARSVFLDPKMKQTETGEPSSYFCSICMEKKSAVEIFRATVCSHSFCIDCTSSYLSTKVQENIGRVKCPDLKCRAILDPDNCRRIIPREVYDRWEQAICESVIMGCRKVCCPCMDCSGFMVDDGVETVTSSECLTCHRLFCVQCNIPWHGGFSCIEFKARDDRKLDEMAEVLAASQKWKKCSNCRFYVEKTSGCNHITCRCGFEFCYVCGCAWNGNSGHSCP